MMSGVRYAVVVFMVMYGVCAQDIRTVMEFSREINTCDAAGDNPIEAMGTTRVVWSYHEDQIPSDEDSILYHSHRGSESLNLVGQPLEVPPLEPDVQPLDIQVEDVHVPTRDSAGEIIDTVYWCKTFELPSDRRRHAVLVEPIIDPRHAENVHHILIYWCDLDPNQPEYDGPCYDAVDLRCLGQRIVTGWAVGGQGEYLPQDVGLPIGGEGGPIRVLMEVHYDNPQMEEDIVDSSGMRFWLTEQLRPIEAGVMAVGPNVPQIEIPPEQEAYTQHGYCASHCTEVLPPEGVTIHSAVLHSHLAGRKMVVQHLRDGKELPNVYADQNYDFNYQQSYTLKPSVTLLPGDELITTCTYNTIGRNFTTYGGESTREEMCYAYMTYYPAHLDLGICISDNLNIIPGVEFAICREDLSRPFEPMEFEPLTPVDECLDYEKPDLPRDPQRMTVFDPTKYKYSSVLDQDGHFRLHWNYDEEAQIIELATDVDAAGWTGFGISTGSGSMVGSDVVIGYLDDLGQAHFRDRKAFAFALPPIDDSQDLFDIRVGKFLVESFNNTETYKSVF